MARLRLCAAYAAYWGGRPRAEREPGPAAAWSISPTARTRRNCTCSAAWPARLGDAASARLAIAAARDARDREHHDELLEIGGELASPGPPSPTTRASS